MFYDFNTYVCCICIELYIMAYNLFIIAFKLYLKLIVFQMQQKDKA